MPGKLNLEGFSHQLVPTVFHQCYQSFSGGEPAPSSQGHSWISACAGIGFTNYRAKRRLHSPIYSKLDHISWRKHLLVLLWLRSFMLNSC